MKKVCDLQSHPWLHFSHGPLKCPDCKPYFVFVPQYKRNKIADEPRCSTGSKLLLLVLLPIFLKLNMRLLTHNTLRNNAADAKGGGYPLIITASEIRVDGSTGSPDEEVIQREVAFVRGLMGMLDWDALVGVREHVCM